MVIKNVKKPISFTILLLLISTTIILTHRPGHCQNSGYSLMIISSPEDAGHITPAKGIFRPGLNEVVTLRAIPKAGYQFVYWLGDVTNVAANQTTIFVNAPKMVVAVFERTEFDILGEPHKQDEDDKYEFGAGGGVLGGAGWIPSTIRRGGRKSAARGAFPPFEWEEDEIIERNFPIPEPIPEPATMAFLGLGAAVMLKKRQKRKHF